MIRLDPNGRVLVLGAHPDDEVMCGGLIARLADLGCTIHHHFFSDCSTSTIARGHHPDALIRECEESRDVLGIAPDGRGQFDFPVRRFPEFRQRILDALLAIRKSYQPTLVLTSATDDIHQDHSTVTQEAIRAFKHCTILGYESPWNQLTTKHDFMVSLDQSHLDRKLAAMACYRTQSAGHYFQEDFIVGLARVRGVQAAVRYAESYQIIRMVV